MKLTTVGIDLAKSVFQAHGIDERGKLFVKRQLRRVHTATFFVNLPPHGAPWSLRSQRSRMVVGVVVPSFDYPMYARSLSALLTLPRLHTYQQAV